MNSSAYRHSTIRLLIASLLITSQPMPLAWAEIIADPGAPRQQQAVVLQTANGLPLVNIQAPSAAGVSHNTYQQFDVAGPGAILNNSTQSFATQLGGWVQANPQLANGSARVILNEVNSSHPSQLQGFVEIAGSQAELVIANPAGIQCNGCGFINASQVSLSTGRPVMQSGDLAAYRVGGGSISITGHGMDASQVNYTQIIARAVAINAGLWAQHVQVTTGLNQVGRKGEIQQRDLVATAANQSPEFALDVAALGGMYARKIHLIGTEAGVGVRNSGHIGASAGELMLMSDGRLLNTGSLSSQGQMQINNRAGITNSGSMLSEGNLQLSSVDDIRHSGSLLAQGDIKLLASADSSQIDLTSQSLTAAGVDMASGNTLNFGPAGKLSVTASNISANGQQLSAGEQSYLAQQLDLLGSQISAGQLGLSATAGDINLSDSRIAIRAGLDVNTEHLLNTSGASIEAQALNLKAGQLNNTAGSLLQTGSDSLVLAFASGLENAQGRIQTQGDLRLSSLYLHNQQGLITAVQGMDIQSQGVIDNEQGQLVANQQVDIRGSQINNQAGSIGSIHNGVSLSSSTGSLNNGSGRIEAATALTLDARGINNQQGVILGSSLSADSHGQGLDNQQGRILAAGNASNDTLKLNANTLSNQDGEITGRQSLYLDTAQIDNSRGAIRAAGDLTLENAGDLVQSGEITSQGKLTLKATSLDNQQGAIIQGQDTQLDILGLLSNRGTIDGEHTWISAQNISNLGTGLILGSHLAMQADQLGNAAEGVSGSSMGAAIAARERLDLGIRTLSNADGSLIFSGGSLAIGRQLDKQHQAQGQAESVENVSASIESLTNMRIDAVRLVNQRRTLGMQRVQTSSTTDYYTECRDPKCSYVWHIRPTTTIYADQLTSTSPQAVILAGGDARLNMDTLINQYSSIEAGGSLQLNAGQLSNQGAQLYRQTDIATSKNLIHWGNRDHGTTYESTSSSVLIDSIPAIISAGGVLSGNISGSIDNVNIRANTAPLAKGNSQPISSIQPSKTDRNINSTLSANVAPGQVNADQAQSQQETGLGLPGVDTATPLPPRNISLNALFRPAPEVGAKYLIETNPRFTSYRQWLSSDYMLEQLAFDPAITQKRLGDGFYEQRLVLEQINQLTGRRFLTGYGNDEAQFQALMNNGLTQAKSHQLIPGVALSDVQMAQLTSDIVWLVQEDIVLPYGRRSKALVPHVYLMPRSGDLKPDGALLAGESVKLQVQEQLHTSGTIAGRQLVSINATNIENLRGLISGKDVSLSAKQDITLLGGQVRAEDSLNAKAGNNLSIKSSTVDLDVSGGSVSVKERVIDRLAGLYVSKAGATLLAQAGNNLELLGAEIHNQGSSTSLEAGKNLTLGVVQETSNGVAYGRRSWRREQSSTEIGSSVQSQGDISLKSGNNILLQGSEVNSTHGNLNASAGKDITISTAESTLQTDAYRKVKTNSRTKQYWDSSDSTTQKGSTLSAENISLQAGLAQPGNLNITGSAIVATQDNTLQASGNIQINSAANSAREDHLKKEKRSGFSASGNSIGYSSSKLSQNQNTSSVTQLGSSIGSLQGDVSIKAGQTYQQSGSDILTPQGDINISAQCVEISAAQNTVQQHSETKYKQSGVSLSLSNPLINAIQSASQTIETSSNSDNNRVKLLAALNLAQTANAAYDELKVGQGETVAGKPNQIPTGNTLPDVSLEYRTATAIEKAGGIAIKLSIGNSSSESSSSQTIVTSKESQLTAGGNITISASGAQKASDITIQGGKLKAGEAMSLKAEDQILLQAAQNSQTQTSQNKSSSNSLGIGINMGGSRNGFSLEAGASRGKGQANGSDQSWTETTITAGKIASLDSGGDTTLKGAQVKAPQIVANIGTSGEGKLTIESLQDSSQYQAKQKTTGITASLCMPPFCYGASSGGISQEKAKANSDYLSVLEQAGLFAGDSGFQINVQGETSLIGALINSSKQAVIANKNTLHTETLTTSNIQNQMEAQATRDGFSASSSMLNSKYALAKGALGNVLNSEKQQVEDSSVALSDISSATVTVGDTTYQPGENILDSQGNLVNSDTENTNRTLNKPDLAAMQLEIQQRQAENALLISTIGSFTDEAFRKMFISKAKVYKVERKEDGTIKTDEKTGKPKLTELSEIEKQNLKSADGGNVKIFNNGIQNSLDKAADYAVQIVEAPVSATVYLLYFPEANNLLSELMITAYQNLLDNNKFGLTEATETLKVLAKKYGKEGLDLIGHSRGNMTIGNALKALKEEESSGVLSDTNIKLVGPAFSAQEAANLLKELSAGNKNTVQLQNHMDDFVGRIIGGNDVTYGTRPAGSNMIREWIHIFGDTPTAHSCYGSGGHEDCNKNYGTPITSDVKAKGE